MERKPSTGLRVAVVGGGISGLSAAYRLTRLAERRGLDLSLGLFERGQRLGGQIRTERAESVLVEAGPDSLVAHKPAALELCRSLGLDDELVRLGPGRRPALELEHRGRLHALPPGFFLMAPTRIWPLLTTPLLSWRGKLRMAAERFVPPAPPSGGDESLRSFVLRRFGREAFERVAEPILAGLHTADADRMSLRMTMPRWLDLETRDGSVTRGMRRAARARKAGSAAGFVSLRSGLGTLVDRLVAALPRGSIRTGVAVDRLSPARGSRGWRLAAGDREIGRFDAVVLACPADAAAKLLAPLDAALCAELGKLSYASCATVNLLYPRESVSHPLRSFGFFVPRSAGLPILACSFMSEKFPDRVPRDRVLLRAFLGGATAPGILEHEDPALATFAHDALARLLGLDAPPLWSRVHRFPEAMPQFPVGHAASVELLERRLDLLPAVSMCGTASGVVGVPDCVASGRSAAERVLESLVASAGRLELAG